MRLTTRRRRPSSTCGSVFPGQHSMYPYHYCKSVSVGYDDDSVVDADRTHACTPDDDPYCFSACRTSDFDLVTDSTSHGRVRPGWE